MKLGREQMIVRVLDTPNFFPRHFRSNYRGIKSEYRGQMRLDIDFFCQSWQFEEKNL